MTPQALWKIHKELDEIEREREEANERIMRLVNVPIISREEANARLKILSERMGTDEKWWKGTDDWW